MYLKFFKFISVFFLFVTFLMPREAFGQITTFPYIENFDTGSGTTPPAGWTQDPTNGEDWEFNTSATYAAPSDHTSGTGIIAWVDDSTPYSNPSNLLSPTFDITGLTTPSASFWYWIGAGNAGPSYLNVDISTDGGTTWADSVITALVENNQWDEVTIDLTLYSSDSLVIRFSGYENLSGFNCDIAIDDFTVSDLAAPPACAVNLSPPDGEDSVSVYTDLSWTSGGGDPTGYLIYFGTDNPPTNIENGTDLGNVTIYTPSSTLSSGITYYWRIVPYNVNGQATGCDIWSFTTYHEAPLSGTYTVGLNEFIKLTGKQVYFETRTRTITKNINGEDAVVDINNVEGEEKTEILNPDLSPRYVTVTETYKELMENGQPFDRNFYQLPESRGVYPTLTEAVNDLNLRGVSGPVTFSLVDTYYPNETYPILIDVDGTSSTNTVTIKPASGIQTEIPGDPAQPTSTLQLGYSDYVIIDGSNTPGGTTKDLKIVGMNGDPAIQFYGDASNNIVKNLVAESDNPSTGSGVIIFGAGPFASDNNLIENCTVKNIDTLSTRPGVGIYFFSTNTGSGNSIIGCDIFDFDDYGLRLQGAPTVNTFVSDCEVYMTDDVSTSATYGAYVSRVEGLVIEKSKFYNFAGSTVRGIYLSGNSTSGDFIIRNNFISLANSSNTSGILSGIDYFGFAANSLEAYHNSVYLGGTDVTGSSTTYALTKRDDATTFKAYNNAVYTARSNGAGTGTHYAVYVSDTNTVTFEMDYNDYFADGNGGVLGYYSGTDYSTLTDWQTASGQDANSLSADPGFVGNDDLHIKPFINNLDGQGLYLASVPDDIDGDARNMTTPDIGADEYTYVPPSVIDPTNVTATVVSFEQIDVGFTTNANNDNVVIVFNLDGNFTTPSGPPPAPGNPFAGGTLIANTTTSPFSHTGLTELTTYYYRLFSYDGVDYSFGVSTDATTPLATITTFPWNDDLENPGQPGIPLGWTQDTGDDFDWAFDAGGTPSTGTGPSVDHNPGTSTGTYGYTEATGPSAGDISNIITPQFDVSGLTSPVFSFWYHMDGAAMGTLNVDYSTDGGTTWTNGWTLSGDQGDTWFLGYFALPTDANFVRFSGTIGTSFTSDMAFDDVTVLEAAIAPPSDLLAVADTFSVELFWTDNSDNETGFVIERKLGDSTSGNPYVVVDTAGVNSTTYINTGLDPNTMYTFRVKGINQFTESGYSNQAEVQTKVPVELTSFVAEVNGKEVVIRWSTATETNNSGFEVERHLEENWEKIGFLEGKGTVTEESQYSFGDKFEYKSFKGVISYRLKQIDFDGRYTYSNTIEVDVDFTPKEYTLYQNYPNPFNPNTTIKYALPFDSNVKIGVYNLLGELVTELVNTEQATGYHDAVWNAGSVASGTYFYVINAKSTDGKHDFNTVKKMLLVK